MRGTVMLGVGLLASLWAGAAAGGGAAETVCGPAVDLARRLAQGAQRPRTRRDWLDQMRALERCSDGFPADPRAPVAALAQARLTADLHRRSGLRSDYDLAALRFRTVGHRWPKSAQAPMARLLHAELVLEFGSFSESLRLFDDIVGAPEGTIPPKLRRRAVRARAILRGLENGRIVQSGPAAGPTSVALRGPRVALPGSRPGPVVPSKILAIKVQRVGAGARIMVSTDRPVTYSFGEIPPQEGRPARVYVDIPGSTLSPRVDRIRTFPQSRLLKVLRAAPNRVGQARVVVELAEDVAAQVSGSKRPQGVNIDLRPRAIMMAPEELQTPAGLTLSEAAAMPIRRVVVDAGHGGEERGAVGPGGLPEKEVNLDVVRRLVPLLQRQGLEVILTRDDDRTVPLEARTRRANEVRADLFISIHSNASTDRKVDGVEVYYLDLTDDAYARRLAQRENQGAGRSIADLRLLVADLMTRAHTADSRALAASISTGLQRALRKGPAVGRGVRQALFFVLLGAEMPAVLCELSYLSNPKAEQEMRTPTFRQRAAEGIARGVAAYIAARRQRIAGSPVRSTRRSPHPAASP